jgi:hypothetical protein
MDHLLESDGQENASLALFSSNQRGAVILLNKNKSVNIFNIFKQNVTREDNLNQ